MPNLTDQQRRCIIDELLKRSVGDNLPHGAKAAVARQCSRTPSAIGKIWSQYRVSIEAGVIGGVWQSRIKWKSGRKKLDRQKAAEKLRSLPIEDRSVERRAAELSGLSRHMARALLAEGTLNMVTARIRPTLTTENKLARIEHVLTFIDETTGNFEAMDNVVHVDEKWFYEDHDKRSYLLFPGEDPPHRTRKSKRFIPKTMFLAAVARPRYDPHRKCTWDGKIGLWPLTEEYVALRTSRYRAKGTVCTRNIEVIDREIYRDYLVRLVIPSIKEKWPRGDRRRPILIQQDNAKPHVAVTDPVIVTAGHEDGWCIRMLCQPANSPDLNALDLGLFNAIQSIQNRVPIHGIDNLVAAVEQAYKAMNKDTLDNIFLTLQSCMLCILNVNGDNTYKLPHLGKATLRRREMLPRVLKIDQELYDKAKGVLVEAGRPSMAFF